MTTRLATIFSTGDPGAARGALDAAAELELKIGGHTAADPPAPYAEHLRRTLAPRMAARLNVQDSDGTLILSFSTSLKPGRPEAYADEASEQQRKPLLHVVLPTPEHGCKGILAWIEEEKIVTLHVTGPRESEEPGIQQAVHDALVWIFEDEVQPRATFAGVDRTTTPEPLRSYDEFERLAAELAAMPSPTHIAINPANVDAAIAAGLDVQWVAPPSAPIDAEFLVDQDIEWRPPPVPPELTVGRADAKTMTLRGHAALLAERLRQSYGISPAIAAIGTAMRKIDEMNAVATESLVASAPTGADAQPVLSGQALLEWRRENAATTPATRVGLVQQLANEGHITQGQARELLEAPQVEPKPAIERAPHPGEFDGCSCPSHVDQDGNITRRPTDGA